MMPDALHARSTRANHHRWRPETMYLRFYRISSLRRDGGLISYGPDGADMFRRSASYVDRILRGEKPADLPVQQPVKFRDGHQPQNRQGARPHRAAIDSAARRRGDRMRTAGVHRGARRRGGVAAGGAGAAARARAADRRAHGVRRKRSRRQRLGSPGSRRGLRSWVGPMAATCGWTFVGPATMSTGCGCSRKSWSDLQPDVILACNTPATAALQRETRTIPIVFVVVSDPVGSGFVANLPRPGGNLTGFINLEASMGGKWLELLTEIAPGVKRAAIMFNPDTAPYGGSYLPALIRGRCPIAQGGADHSARS